MRGRVQHWHPDHGQDRTEGQPPTMVMAVETQNASTASLRCRVPGREARTGQFSACWSTFVAWQEPTSSGVTRLEIAVKAQLDSQPRLKRYILRENFSLTPNT